MEEQKQVLEQRDYAKPGDFSSFHLSEEFEDEDYEEESFLDPIGFDAGATSPVSTPGATSTTSTVNAPLEEGKGHDGSCEDVHEGVSHEDWEAEAKVSFGTDPKTGKAKKPESLPEGFPYHKEDKKETKKDAPSTTSSEGSANFVYSDVKEAEKQKQ